MAFFTELEQIILKFAWKRSFELGFWSLPTHFSSLLPTFLSNNIPLSKYQVFINPLINFLHQYSAPNLSPLYFMISYQIFLIDKCSQVICLFKRSLDPSGYNSYSSHMDHCILPDWIPLLYYPTPRQLLYFSHSQKFWMPFCFPLLCFCSRYSLNLDIYTLSRVK